MVADALAHHNLWVLKNYHLISLQFLWNQDPAGDEVEKTNHGVPGEPVVTRRCCLPLQIPRATVSLCAVPGVPPGSPGSPLLPPVSPPRYTVRCPCVKERVEDVTICQSQPFHTEKYDKNALPSTIGLLGSWMLMLLFQVLFCVLLRLILQWLWRFVWSLVWRKTIVFPYLVRKLILKPSYIMTCKKHHRVESLCHSTFHDANLFDERHLEMFGQKLFVIIFYSIWRSIGSR